MIATRGFCLHTTLCLQPSLVLRALGAGAERVNRPNLFPKRESLCNFGRCLQLVQKQAKCSVTDGQDIALLGELAPGQNQHGHVPPGCCYQLMQLRSKLDSSFYLICLFRLNHHFAVGKSSKIKLQKLTCVSYCLNLPKRGSCCSTHLLRDILAGPQQLLPQVGALEMGLLILSLGRR